MGFSCQKAPEKSTFVAKGKIGMVDFENVPTEEIMGSLLKKSLVIQLKTKQNELVSVYIPEPAAGYEGRHRVSSSFYNPGVTVHRGKTIVFRSFTGEIDIHTLNTSSNPFVKGKFFAVSGNDAISGEFNVLLQ